MTTVILPDGPSLPRFVQGGMALAAPLRTMRRLRQRYGSAFTIDVPVFGKAVVISDPAEVKQLFTTSPEIADNLDINLGRVLGPNSFFAISGDAHKKQRKLLVPPFHGRRLRAYEAIVEEEAVREMATWPEGAEFATLDSMMRITLSAILRAVFGADGAELAALRELLPAMVKLGSRLAVLPIPRIDLGRWSPWGRGLAYRREYDAIVDRLIAAARQDPRLDERNDVLALMLQSRYDDGVGMSRDEIADQLLTLLTAGHETTATTLAWAVERLRRHPAVLRRLADEADAGGSDLREATILEVQRVRPVIDRTARQVRAPSMRLGRWTLPQGQVVLVSIYLIHTNEALFPDARRFDPARFAGSRPDTTAVPRGSSHSITQRQQGAQMARTRRLITGRPVMITGAASGIGRSLARRLSRYGSPVAIADIDEAGLKDTAKSLPGPALIRVLDVRDATDQHRFAAEVREWLTAPLAAVFNNAGVAVASSVLEADPGDDEWLRQINFDGVVNGTRAFLPILTEQDDGVIVNTSSVFGLLGMPYQSAYCASKFAVRGFTDALRQELRGTGVSAVTVHPGGITTSIARNARVRKDPEGRGRSHEQMAADFEAITMTTPDKAAEIICRGVERGKARILVGPDAYIFDALARVAPTHYYDVVARFEKRLRSRQAAR